MIATLYRLALRWCPQPQRDLYGDEMLAAFLTRVGDVRAERGRAAALLAAGRGVTDAIAFALEMRRSRVPVVSNAHTLTRRPSMFLRDLRTSLKLIRHQPFVTAAVVGMLALGFGAATAIFSVVHGVLLRPLPFPEQSRLVQISTSTTGALAGLVTMSEANFWDLHDMNGAFTDVGAWHGASFTLTGIGQPRRVRAARVSAGFFRALAVAPPAGRLFTPDDETIAGGSRVLLSYATWTTDFARDASVVGRQLTLDGRPHEIVGVLPPGTPWLDSAEMFVPFVRRARQNRGSWEYSVIGRIKPGLTAEQAQADLNRVARALETAYPENKGQGMVLQSSDLWIASDGVRRTLWMLLGAAALLLIIAAVNVTNLMLARASARIRESAVRAALGASRRDLIRERLADALVLSVLAVLVGAALAEALLRFLLWADPGGIPRLSEVTLNLPALAFGAAAALLVGLGVGLVTSLQTPAAALTSALRSGGRGATTDRRTDRLRTAFVAAEIALSIVLLVGAGLLVRSLMQVLQRDRGFTTENRVVATVSLPVAYGEARLDRLATDILQKIQQHPDVESAALVSGLPLAGGSTGLGTVPGDRPFDQDAPWATWRLVTGDYFRAIGVPLISGRTFSEQDLLGEPWRVIISRRLAEAFWPGENPVGRPIVLWKGQGNRMAEVVGVVGDMRERGLEGDPTLAVYLPAYGNLAQTTLRIVAQARTDAARLPSILRDAVAAIDPMLPVSEIRPLDAIVARSVATRRFTMLLLSTFAGLAFVLALAGVYGVLAYSISRRRQEVGVRMALGAPRRTVLTHAVFRGLRPVITGAVIGLAAAVLAARAMTSLLLDVTPYDPQTYAVVCAAVLATALIACYVPARAVLKVDPLVALRE